MDEDGTVASKISEIKIAELEGAIQLKLTGGAYLVDGEPAREEREIEKRDEFK